MHIHLDLVGGISGDMFAGALLDCFPENFAALESQIELAGFARLVKLACNPANDGTLTGTKFEVDAVPDADAHHHRHYSEIRKIIGGSNLTDGVKNGALAIFKVLAEAEASVHGHALEDVTFHEVGAWDSIADVIAAAYLIHQLGEETTWSVSKLPLGSGQVETAHGRLPIPAPATSLLLKGFDFYDDGLEGERITPTGAAILNYLNPGTGLDASAGRLIQSGYGFGSKKFPGISNVLRALVFDTGSAGTWSEDQVLQLEFEIDDQTGEELANALETLRGIEGVLDVLQMPAFGKKGRPVNAVRILAKAEVETSLVRRCFEETTTLGIRKRITNRSILDREEVSVQAEGAAYHVKIARRPSGISAKVDMDDIARYGNSIAERRRERAAIEARALSERETKKHPDE